MNIAKAVFVSAAFLILSVNATAQAQVGSIYNPDRGPYGLIANKTAARPGDLVTVIISESQDLSNEESSDLSTTKDLDYELSTFNIKPGAFSTLPSLASGSSDTFSGSANYAKSGNFTARITAMVVDTLPNGNMVIAGRREIRIDNETKLIEFRGVVRRYDIKPDNTVESELVADARVSYTGSGPMTKATNRHGLGGFLHDAFVWIWPF